MVLHPAQVFLEVVQAVEASRSAVITLVQPQANEAVDGLYFPSQRQKGFVGNSSDQVRRALHLFRSDSLLDPRGDLG